MHTFVITVWPPWAATKSFTLPGWATSRWLPPMKCDGRSYFAAAELGVPLAWPLIRLSLAPAIVSDVSPMQ